jgi:digeranylgeranylglycerophospholipid reductase
VFPKSGEEILVGGALYRSRPGFPKVKDYVDRFLAGHVPEAPPYRETMITGGIPVTVSPKKLVRDNIVLVGDAARQVNPLTAGGIMNALEAAEMASKYLIARGRKAATGVPDSYSATWKRNQRRQHTFFMLVREIWFSTPEVTIIPRLKIVFSLVGKAPDRSRPFRLPAAAAVRFLFGVLPLTIKNIRVLFR